MIKSISLLIAWGLDLLFGDPVSLPHPVVGFGKMIDAGEKAFNRGNRRFLKGMILTLLLVAGIFFLMLGLQKLIANFSPLLLILLNALFAFYCLAGTTLIREVRKVFLVVEQSLPEGRRQVARIVGRDTSEMSAQEIRSAALETLSENLSDGVIAPLFWYLLAGVPGMMAYKMINTLDSMIGYRNERYKDFGRFAARLDDVVNYLPARLTAFLMVLVSGKFSLFSFVRKEGKQHTSPNAGYPEAALAGILNCRFGGPHNYFGEEVWKPFIGYNDRLLTTKDMERAIRINRMTELVMMAMVLSLSFLLPY